jgi:CTP synthase
MGKVKYIFVTGGVTSSLGKGIISASLGKLLTARGLHVTIQKFDPYINIDPGTLNPYEHGECYVTEDGAETDLDLGHYERFLAVNTSQKNNVTTGRIYNNVITKEREGEYLGTTVQVIPHITDEIKRNFLALGHNGDYDIIITEIGGSVGDIESLPFIEAIRQTRWDLGHEHCIVIHLTLIPYLKAVGELKTKPTQHSVKMLLESGIQPDILVCRSERAINADIRKKLALFCNVAINSVISSIDAKTIYDVPLLMRKEKLDERVLQLFKIENGEEPQLDQWKDFLVKLKNPKSEVNIALVGKYVELHDAYKSIAESLIHAGASNEVKANVRWVPSETVSKENVEELLGDQNGILIAPGFGERGFEGKIAAAKYAREKGTPFLGICLGLQVAVIEFGRNVLGLKNANSTEMDPKTKEPIIDLMEEQKKITKKGGTMRLGAYPCTLKEGNKVFEMYGEQDISERHRHRYEFNNDYLDRFEQKGMMAAGVNPDSNLVEIMELKNHPWYVGTQFHPELKSRVLAPHPLFIGFIKAAMANQANKSTNRS